MPFSTGSLVLLLSFAMVFATFGYMLVNARSLMRLFRPMSDGDIVPGPGERGPSKAAILAALLIHFAAWGLAAFAWLYLLADVRASAPDTTPLEAAGAVHGADGGDGNRPAAN
ncbi:MAG: hypothetical protein QFB89_03260 [Pseudomonadota bacterium]|nr:hypothetical protein [Pseudomonadota bacterium]